MTGWPGADPQANRRWDHMIMPEVVAAAKEWPLGYRSVAEPGRPVEGWATCGHCEQGIMRVRSGGSSYTYTDEQRVGMVLAHLIQRHGWSRERIGNQEVTAA